MKNFCDIEKGDTIYLIDIVNSKLSKDNIIKEYEVKNVESEPGSIHSRITLSDDTVITPSNVFPFHTISVLSGDVSKKYDTRDEIYSTDKEECIRIASNCIKIKISKITKEIEKYKDHLLSLGLSKIQLQELKKKMPIEVMAETVIV